MTVISNPHSIFTPEDLTKNERLTAYRRGSFTQGKEGRKGDVSILSFFLTFGNDYDGDFEPTFNFHNEDLTKAEPLIAFGDR